MNDGITCPLCNGPTIFESKNCRSFLNHIRKCVPIGSQSSQKTGPHQSHELPNDQFFLSMNRSLNFSGISLLQSSKKNDNLMNATDNHEYVLDCPYDESNADDFDEVDEISSMKIPFSENDPLQPHVMFQVQMRNMIAKQGAPLCLYDRIMSLMNSYLQSGNYFNQPFMSSSVLQKHLESIYNTTPLKPLHRTVSLSNGSKVTVPTFDVENMILSMVMNDKMMTSSNYAPGYNIYTGQKIPNHPHNMKYGEIHTGKAWDTALTHYCGNDDEFMPLALVVFGDKSHTDLHGALSLTPLIFTLSLFNRTARNRVSFWRPMAYVPNLSFGKGESDSALSVTKLQDEHICLAAAFQSVIEINKRGGMSFSFGGKLVRAKVWIHYFVGDTEGNNKWLGQYNSSNQGVSMPYRDCKCSFEDMDNTRVKCQFFKLSDISDAEAEMDANQSKDVFRNMSKHPIQNALLRPDLSQLISTMTGF